jgi:ribosomal protein L37AE/L43A
LGLIGLYKKLDKWAGGKADAVSNWFRPRREVSAAVSVEIVPAPSQTRVDNRELQKKQNRECPVCGKTCTFPLGSPGNIHCNQCQVDFNADGVVTARPAEFIIGVDCCEEAKRKFALDEKPYVQKTPAGPKCNGCEKQAARPSTEPVNGCTKAQLNRWRRMGQFAIRADVGYKNTFGRFG